MGIENAVWEFLEGGRELYDSGHHTDLEIQAYAAYSSKIDMNFDIEKVYFGNLRAIQEYMFKQGYRDAYNEVRGRQNHAAVIFYHAYSDNKKEMFIGYETGVNADQLACALRG